MPKKYQCSAVSNDNRTMNAGTDQEPGTHKPICAACKCRMIRLYIRGYDPDPDNHRRNYIGIGWICPSCSRVIRD